MCHRALGAPELRETAIGWGTMAPAGNRKRMRDDFLNLASAVLVMGLLACSSAAPPSEPVAAPAPEPPAADFSGERAWSHLDSLERFGPRPAGSEGARRARAYLADALRELGLEVTEQRSPAPPVPPEPSVETVNLLAALAGSSQDLIVLVAPYDSAPGEAGSATGDGASGAALLLELGRALQARGPTYTVLLAFVEGDALAGGAGSGGLAPESVGTGALVAALAGGEGLARVRLAVEFDRVAAPDLRIARDLLSSRTLREEFWSAARRLGHTAVFPPAAPFEAVEVGLRAFAAEGMRRVVAIVGSRPEPGAAESPAPADDAQRASRENLGAVGAVSLDAIGAISQRLARIDRFVRSPLSTESEAAAP